MVIHLAARVHVMREKAADTLLEFRRMNAEGTTRTGVEESVDATPAEKAGAAGAFLRLGHVLDGGRTFLAVCWLLLLAGGGACAR